MTAQPIDWTPPWLAHHQITAAEYEALSPEECQDIEIIDGMVVVSPAPIPLHQDVQWLIRGGLHRAGMPEWRASTNIDVRIAEEPLNNRRPDVVAYPAGHSRRVFVPAVDTLLVVEIVSPGSETNDRKIKPIIYADAGIPYYWRVEISESVPVAYTYRRDEGSGRYQPQAQYVGMIDTQLPFPVKIDLTED